MNTTAPSLAISLLILLSLLLSQAQGIRLEKGFISVKQQNKNIHEDTTVLTKETAESIVASDVLGKDCGHDDHCASSGSSSRKLITVTSSTPTPKNEKNTVGKQVRNSKAESPSASSSNKNHKKEEEEEVATTRQQYPDLIDMTEMDYSPARRKPPIHN